MDGRNFRQRHVIWIHIARIIHAVYYRAFSILSLINILKED